MTNPSNVEILKRDRLRVHFAEVEKLASAWAVQLRAEEPFPAVDSEIWPMSYKPSLEGDRDNNHMLRRHIKSRALWKHHADWQRKLELVNGLCEMLAIEAASQMEAVGQSSPDLNFSKMFARTALEVAFVKTMGRSSPRKYEPKSGHGFNFGGILIERVASADSIDGVKDVHSRLIDYLAVRPELKEIVGCWNDLKETESRMIRIVEVILKSGDIFYPCRFCRKLL